MLFCCIWVKAIIFWLTLYLFLQGPMGPRGPPGPSGAPVSKHRIFPKCSITKLCKIQHNVDYFLIKNDHWWERYESSVSPHGRQLLTPHFHLFYSRAHRVSKATLERLENPALLWVSHIFVQLPVWRICLHMWHSYTHIRTQQSPHIWHFHTHMDTEVPLESRKQFHINNCVTLGCHWTPWTSWALRKIWKWCKYSNLYQTINFSFL